MKKCEKCVVDVVGKFIYCPLCQHELIDINNENKCESGYPVVIQKESKEQLVFKMVTFIALVGSFSAFILNWIMFPDSWWSVIVIGTLWCVWLSIVLALQDYKNILKYLLYQSVIIIGFSIFIDNMTGWSGWSIQYVVPFMLTIAMLTMYVLSKVLQLDPGDYIIYLLIEAFFAIVLIICSELDWMIIKWPTMVCSIVNFISLASLIVFEGKNMYSELKRRFHI
ncbi:MAG: DUF6320 domain-containing protein [Cellulosilyticaceae bacterium]